MVAAATNLLGIGLYTPAEAALYARVSTALMKRWLFGNKSGLQVVRPQLSGDTDEKFVTFLDFVQAMAIRSIRKEHRISLEKIRVAVDRARKTYRVGYPFAMKHSTYLYGGEIVIRLDDEQFVQISGRGAHQRMLGKIVEVYARDLHYDANGVADLYTAYRWGNVAITQDPKFAFGEPLLRTCGYTAMALWDAVKSEGSPERAAEVCGVKLEEVEAACRYCDSLMPATTV